MDDGPGGPADAGEPSASGDDLAALLARVRDRVTPDAAERERLDRVAARLRGRAEAAVADLPVDAETLRVGSTARGTWLAGDRDIDLFVRFPADLPRERLAAYGLRVGHAVLPGGREEYAQHPYVTGTVDGFDVDLVPCYDVPTAAEARSAVDRTPFHTAYLADRLDDRLAGAVRVAKRFLTGVGAYGSDLRTRGFSGYLTELLVLEHDGVAPLLRSAADWAPPVRYDPAGHGDGSFDDPLVVIDPTDPERNVAAVVSADNVARVQHHARDLLADPRESVFFPPDPEPLDAEGVRAHLRRRDTTPVALRFGAPDLVDDRLWPQLRKSLSGIAGGLDDRGFEPLRAEAMAAPRGDDTAAAAGVDGGADDGGRPAALLFELAVATRPAVERHEGPPVAVRDHAAGFYRSYADGDAYGPFVDGGRYVVEREREFTAATDYLESDALLDVGLGADLEGPIADREVHADGAVAALAERFGRELRRYFEPRP